MRCNDGRNFLMELSDITAVKAAHNIKQAGLTNICYLHKTWANQNYTRKSCWKLKDSSGFLKVPISKGGLLIICFWIYSTK
jgi:hypothetical protein